MNHLKHQASKLFDPDTAPDHTIQIKVPGNALRAVVSNGLKKTTFCERYLPHNYSRWVSVEASEHGTNDSVFFVPERPNVDQSHMRLEPAQFVKVNQNKHDDVVRRGDEFEISFAGMSVAQMDIVGNNELLLCSLTRNDGIMPPDPEIAETTSNQAQAQVSTKNTDMSQTFTAPSQKSDASNQKPLDAAAIKKDKDWIELADLAELPTALTVQPGDIPFLHYDPVVDGHDVGSSPNSFVPIPGSKRVYLQRSGALEQDVLIRFTVMEIDKLSEEQLIAIKSLEDIGKSVGKAAATVPYLKFISWILKFANFLGRSALKKVAEPEHVLSKDMAFLLADPENGDGTTCSVPSSTNSQREEFGNYLRYGYYYFLSSTIDAKLYAQIGASSQNVQLMLRRQGYNPKYAFKNEQEYFPLSGVSYVAIKVSRGHSPLDTEQRGQMLDRHRQRVVKLLKKYTGKLGDTANEDKKKSEN